MGSHGKLRPPPKLDPRGPVYATLFPTSASRGSGAGEVGVGSLREEPGFWQRPSTSPVGSGGSEDGTSTRGRRDGVGFLSTLAPAPSPVLAGSTNRGPTLPLPPLYFLDPGRPSSPLVGVGEGAPPERRPSRVDPVSSTAGVRHPIPLHQSRGWEGPFPSALPETPFRPPLPTRDPVDTDVGREVPRWSSPVSSGEATEDLFGQGTPSGSRKTRRRRGWENPRPTVDEDVSVPVDPPTPVDPPNRRGTKGPTDPLGGVRLRPVDDEVDIYTRTRTVTDLTRSFDPVPPRVRVG